MYKMNSTLITYNIWGAMNQTLKYFKKTYNCVKMNSMKWKYMKQNSLQFLY